MLSFFSGRRLLLSEIPEELRAGLASPNIRRYPTMLLKVQTVQCLRCGKCHRQSEVAIENAYERFYFCPSCIQLGRVQSNQSFYGTRWRPRHRPRAGTLAWRGQLTTKQASVSERVVAVTLKRQTLLVHAVTGAGKTEMMFAALSQALRKGWRVALASPRVDVCLELYPRLQAAFPDVAICLLHGEREEAYRYSALVVCTTHQLLRFYHAFDLLIIDEVDAFPFVGDAGLSWAVANAQKQQAAHIMLTATPTDELNRRVSAGTLEKVVLPARFHGHKLPVPQGLWNSRWRQLAQHKKMSGPLKRLLNKQRQAKRRTLLFCPTVSWLNVMTGILGEAFPTWRIGSAHAKDGQRHAKVKTMRQAGYDVFLTTTIMERGVTFEDIDVIVLGSNHEVFTRSTLVQIAGRAGRSMEAPDGQVYFFHEGWSKAMKEAVEEIRQLNKLAEKEGLIRT